MQKLPLSIILVLEDSSNEITYMTDTLQTYILQTLGWKAGVLIMTSSPAMAEERSKSQHSTCLNMCLHLAIIPAS
jgi:hypothetical protein